MISVVDLRKSFVAPNGERIDVLRGVTFGQNVIIVDGVRESLKVGQSLDVTWK